MDSSCKERVGNDLLVKPRSVLGCPDSPGFYHFGTKMAQAGTSRGGLSGTQGRASGISLGGLVGKSSAKLVTAPKQERVGVSILG